MTGARVAPSITCPLRSFSASRYCATNRICGGHVRSKWKWVFGVTGALLLGVVAFALYVQSRGGHYPGFPAAGFSNLSPPVANTAATSDALVQIDDGTLRGTHIGAAIAFRGIPYARPPVGQLRWEPPQP